MLSRVLATFPLLLLLSSSLFVVFFIMVFMCFSCLLFAALLVLGVQVYLLSLTFLYGWQSPLVLLRRIARVVFFFFLLLRLLWGLLLLWLSLREGKSVWV